MASFAYIWESESRSRLVFWLILVSDQTVADLVLRIHCHMLSIYSVLSCTSAVLRTIGWLMLETIESILLRKTRYHASEASPLKDLLGENTIPYTESFLRFLTAEDKVPCTGSHPCIILRKIEESCIGSFSGSFRGKTGLLTPEASRCDMQTDYHIYISS